MEQQVPRILFSAVSSGAGKTTVVCAVLQALLEHGMRLQSFKCGPDYIDPMFHSRVLGIPSRNLDTYFTDENTTRFLLARGAAQAEFCVLEGVMGHYDGVGGVTEQAGAYDLAKTTQTPAVLIVDARGMSLSLAALIKGFLTYREDAQIRGILLNRISPMLYPRMKELIERELGVPVFGFLPPLADCVFESRHLGLVTAPEIADWKEKLHRLAAQARETIDLDGLLALGQTAAAVICEPVCVETVPGAPVIAIARDEAFSFLYEDNLTLLQELGAKLTFFSPLTDKALPEGTSGLLLCGGYPELYAQKLSQNRPMCEAVKHAVRQGMPCIAECGGFLYLHKTLRTADGTEYPLVGALDAECFATAKLRRFGYTELTAKEDNLLAVRGGKLRVHEFHYFDSRDSGDGFSAQKPVSGMHWECGHTSSDLYAGFPHLYFYSNPDAAERFVRRCAAFANEGGKGNDVPAND